MAESFDTYAEPLRLGQMVRRAVFALILFTLVCGGLYPLLVTGLAQALFSGPANGSLLSYEGRPVGSRLIGQGFTGPGWFHGRPSVTEPPYNAAASQASNLSPGNPAFARQVRERLTLLRAEAGAPPPDADLLTASASGLDPHISLGSAVWQAKRVAASRRLPEEEVRKLIERAARAPLFGGRPYVNVLELNLALQAAAEERKP